NWMAVTHTPGSNYYAPAILTGQPADRIVQSGSDVSLSASASGYQPLSFQWLRSGTNLPGATNATLLLTNFQPSQSGVYSVTVSNIAGTDSSTNFGIWARVPLQFSLQPSDRQAEAGQTATFSVAASGTGPVRYQWRFNGTNLPA